MKIRSILFLLLTLLVIPLQLTALDEAQEKEASLKLNEAFNAYYAENEVAATRAFEEYLKIKGESEVPLRYLARIALAQDDSAKAILYLERAIKADPSAKYSTQLLSEVYIKLNRYDDAMRILTLILKNDPLNERALQMMAYIHQHKKESREASTYYKRLIVAVQKGSGNSDLLSQSFYFLGNYYYENDNFAKSLYYFEKLHALDEDNLRYVLIIGELQKITGQFKKSARTLEELLKKNPDFVEAYESLTETYFILDDARAKPMLQKYLSLKKKQKQGILDGIEKQLEGDDDAALKAYETILAQNQNRLSARVGRYRIYKKRNQDTDARNEAFAVVVIAQRLGGYRLAREYAHITLAYLNSQAEKTKFRDRFLLPKAQIPAPAELDGASEQLAIDFVELYSTHATTLENLNERTVANTYYELTSRTINQLQLWYQAMLQNEAIRKDKTRLEYIEKRIREAKNQLYQARVAQAWNLASIPKMLPDADKVADDAIAVEEGYATAWFVKGIIRYNLADSHLTEYKAAAQFFRKAIQITEEKGKKKVAPASYYFYSGMALEKINDIEQTEKELRRAIELEPHNPTYLNFLGYIFSQHNMNLDEAQTLVLRALEDDPENEAYLDTYGWIQFKRGNYHEALEQLSVAASFAQKKGAVDPVIWFHLAEVHAKLQNTATALEYYHKTLAEIKKASEPLNENYISEQIKKLETQNKQSKKNEDTK